MKITEKTIENLILEYLNGVLKIDAWKNETVGIYDSNKRAYRKAGKWIKKGMSDIQGFLPDGRMLFIEVKKPGGKKSDDQKQFIKDACEYGHVAFFADCLDDVKKWFKYFEVSN